MEKSGSNLIIEYGAGNTVMIQDWGLGGNNELTRFVFSDGTYVLKNDLSW